MTGYVKLEEAGKAEEAGNPALALELFRDARKVFLSVNRKHPRWNPALLRYRVSFCEERIKRLETTVDATTSDLSKRELVALAQDLRKRIKELTVSNQESQRELKLTGEALGRARREAARNVAGGEETERLVTENKALQERLRSQEERVRKLSAELGKLRVEAGLEEAAGRLQQELERARAKRRELAKALEIYNLAYYNVKRKLKDASVDTGRLKAENAALRQKEEAHLKAAAAQDQALAAERKRRQATEKATRKLQADLEARERSAAQADKGRQRLQDEIAELRGFRDKYLKSTARSQELFAELRKVTGKHAEATRSASELREDNKTLAADVKRLDQDLAELKKTHAAALETSARDEAELRASLKRAEARVATLSKDAETLRRKVAEQEKSLASSLQRSQQSETAAQASLRQARQELVDTRRQAADQAAELTRERQQREGEQAKLLARIELLEGQLAKAASTADARAAGARREAAAKMLASSEKQLAELSRRKAALKKQLEDALKLVSLQDAELSNTKERMAELSALGEQLQGKEAEVRAAQTQAAELRQKLAEGRSSGDLLRERLQAKAQEADRLTAALDILQTRNRDLTARIKTLTAPRPEPERRDPTLEEQLLAQKELLERLREERTEANARMAEQLALLRRQEKDITKLEGAYADLKKRHEQQTESIAEHVRDKEHLKAKTQVVDGLTRSLDDADAELAAVQKDLARAVGEKDQARMRLREVESLLHRKEKIIRQYQELAGGRAEDERGAETLLEQVRDLSRQLDSERERRRALEIALVQQDEQSADPPPVQTAGPLADTERSRRARDRQFIIRGLLRQGLAAEREANVEAAVWNYGKALEQDTDNRVALQRMGLIATEQGNDEDAERYLRRAFKLNPDDLNILLPLGFTLVRRQKADLAISMLTRAVALHPENAAVHRCLGVACSTLGWRDSAEVQFRRALEIDEDDKESAFNMAILLAASAPSRMAEAKEWYKKARDLGSSGDPGLDELFGFKN